MVVAGNPEAIKEVLVTKSGDYAGRPQTYINFVTTSGKDFLIGSLPAQPIDNQEKKPRSLCSPRDLLKSAGHI